MNTIVELFALGMKRELKEPIDVSKAPVGIHLNIGAGASVIPGAFPLDWPRWDADTDPIPYHDGTVAVIHAYHFLEHCANPVAMMREFERVLVPGGLLNIVVPHYSCTMAFHDLDHKHYFTLDTWKILLDTPYYSKYGKWRLALTFNAVMGIVDRNLAILTQFTKV